MFDGISPALVPHLLIHIGIKIHEIDHPRPTSVRYYNIKSTKFLNGILYQPLKRRSVTDIGLHSCKPRRLSILHSTGDLIQFFNQVVRSLRIISVVDHLASIVDEWTGCEMLHKV